MTTAAQDVLRPLVFGRDRTTDGVRVEDVGRKAFQLMRMVEAGLPVPPGFVLGTELWRRWLDSGRGVLPESTERMVDDGLRSIESETGLHFGASRRPLLLAVRSGAAASMPGMLETVLNIGLCDATLPGLVRLSGNPRFAWDCYRRLVRSYAQTVHGCPPEPFDSAVTGALHAAGVPAVAELDVAALRRLTATLAGVYAGQVGSAFPQDPHAQLLGAVAAVLRSWTSPRAVAYRTLQDIEHGGGTAVTVQAMVYGNVGAHSGAGVAFTRDPGTGANRPYLDFVLHGQGEDVVAGRQAGVAGEALLTRIPRLQSELRRVCRKLETLFSDMQDFEFTVQEGRLHLLQSRAGQRTPWAALRIACDLVDEGLIDTEEAVRRLAGLDLDTIVRMRLGEAAPAPLAQGLPASPGVARGRVAISARDVEDVAAAGDPVLLARTYVETDDIEALHRSAGLLAASGARTSHAAVVARQLGKVCVVACGEMSIRPDGTLHFGERTVGPGDWLTLDGDSGNVYAGALDLVEERPTELVDRVHGWATAAFSCGRDEE